MTEEQRFNVSLTEAEIRALIKVVGDVRVGDIHPVRIKAAHSALTELRDRQREVEIERE